VLTSQTSKLERTKKTTQITPLNKIFLFINILAKKTFVLLITIEWNKKKHEKIPIDLFLPVVSDNLVVSPEKG
jgi:hypothetical protein